MHISRETIAEEEPLRPHCKTGGCEAPAAAEHPGELIRLRPLKVLVLSSDRNFRIVVPLLLTRRGCEVSSSRAIEAFGQEPALSAPADVVLIDAGDSHFSATRAMEYAQALQVSVGVVLVAGREGPGTNGVPLLDRWGPFPELYAAIQRAARRRRAGCG